VIAPPDPVALVTGGNHHNIAFSPDGRKIVYTGAGTNGTNVQLYVRSLDQLDATAIRGTAGGVGPFFSPDNQWVGFVDQSSRTIKKVSIFGGPAVTICEVPGFASGATWGTAGTIVFGTFSAGLFTVPEGGGQPQALTAPDAKAGEGSHTWPSFLPGANAVVFVTARGGAAMATGQLAVVALDTRKVTRFGVAGSSPRFLPTGHLVYATGDGTLRAQAFDLKTLALTGNPVPVLEGLQVKTTGAANYALSATGSLVSVSGNGLAEPRTLVWVDRAGKEALIAAPPRPYVYAWVSPDGTKASLDVRDEENDIWVWEFARQTLTRLTFDPGSDQYGIWTPNGRQVAFSGTREGASGVFLRSADGTGADQRVTDSGPAQYPNGFTPDGSRLVLRMTTSGSEDDLFTVPIAGPGEARKATPLISTARTDRNAVVAPDGRWIAYESNDSGAFQVFVQPFPDVRGGRWQISTTGGLKPAWSRDGRELFYVANDQLMVTRIDTSQGFKPGTPEALFSTKAYYLRTNGRNYDVAPDGRRFLMIKDQVVAGQAALGMTVVLNWFDEVKARTPVK
jgi:serine/threonine-protein kinase